MKNSLQAESQRQSPVLVFTQFSKRGNPDIFRYKYARAEEAGKEVVAIEMPFYTGVEVLGLITPQ